jgi:hypothetical protein
MIDNGVAMDQDVAESDDSTVPRHSCSQCWIELRELGECLTNDLELALDRRADERTRTVRFEGQSASELLDAPAGLARIP